MKDLLVLTKIDKKEIKSLKLCGIDFIPVRRVHFMEYFSDIEELKEDCDKKGYEYLIRTIKSRIGSIENPRYFFLVQNKPKTENGIKGYDVAFFI